MKEHTNTGCEKYLYKGMDCCLHPCPIYDCPEPMCIPLEFPGGVEAYNRCLEVREILRKGADIATAALQLGLSEKKIRLYFNKGNRVFSNASKS